jgi:hypothetical protein
MHVDVTLDPDRLALALTRRGQKKAERLRIEGDYPQTPVTRWLFSQIGLMHLIAPHFPKRITMDFPVYRQTRRLIAAMYRFERKRPPKFSGPKRPKPGVMPFAPFTMDAGRMLVEYSGGKDSMWHQARAIDRVGAHNVLAVHINGLGQGVASGERKASIQQAKRFGFRHFRIVELKRSSTEKGAAVLRSAKIFDAALVLPLAIQLGASRIITEEPGGGPYFTGSYKSMSLFNSFLVDAGIPVQVGWWKRPKGGVVKALINLRPGWLPEVHNCFRRPNWKWGTRRSWLKRTPTFLPFRHACGSCFKCRLTRLGWLLYGPHHANDKDAVYFIRDTEKWARDRQTTHGDLIGGSFALYLQRCRRRYKLAPRYAA